MKQLKLNGRERAVLRALDFTNGSSGGELLVRTNLAEEDLVDVLNGMMSVGYVEVMPYAESTSVEKFSTSVFEVNPSYAQEIRQALIRP